MRRPERVSRWRTWLSLLFGVAGVCVVFFALSLNHAPARANIGLAGGAIVVAGLIFRFHDYRF